MVAIRNWKDSTPVVAHDSAIVWRLFLEKGNEDIIAYHCGKNMAFFTNQSCGQIDERDYKRVCYNCKCDGNNCDYC